MTYTDETKRILEAVISGDCCSDCNAPNGDRHFDECPQHPENQLVLRPKVERDRLLAELRRDESEPTMAVAVDYIRRLEGFKHLHRDCGERIDGLRDERDELLCRIDELAEEIAELRRQLPDYEVTR